MENEFKAKLLMTHDWKVKGVNDKRTHYDRERKNIKKTKLIRPKNNIFPIYRNVQSYEASNEKIDQNGVIEKGFKQLMSKISKQENIDLGTSKIKQDIGLTISKKDEKLNLKELSYDKIYFKRMLLDEHIRMVYLRKGKINENILRNKPHLRLLLESMMNKTSIKSNEMRKILESEIYFLNNRYKIDKQLHFLMNVQFLNLKQLYTDDVELAVKKKSKQDNLIHNLKNIWKDYNQKKYSSVEKQAKSLVTIVTKWIDSNIKSNKYKILSDLYYIRGLSLMHLGMYETSLKCFRKDGEIGENSNLQVSIDRTKDNIGRFHAVKGNYTEAIKIWLNRLEEVQEEREKPWFCFVIAQCYCLEAEYIKAVDMCNKCIFSACKSKSVCWEFNGNMLLANYSAILGTKYEANIQMNTSISLKALSKAYHCSILLANVDIINKTLEIALKIYKTFRDISISMLQSNWSAKLMKDVHRDSLLEKKIPKKNLYINEKNMDFDYMPRINEKNNILLFSTKKTNQQNVNSSVNDVLNKFQYKKILNTIVDVCLDDIYEICCNEELDGTHMSDSVSTSPITAVEIVISDESEVDNEKSEWSFKSEENNV